MAPGRTGELASASSDVGPETPSRSLHLEGLEDFGAGPTGIRRATRTWKRRPYPPSGPEWARERFTNAIGYRLLELSRQGRDADCVTAIRYLANNAGFDQAGGLLGDLARGFELRSNVKLAVLCHTLAWTRTRGGGGWNAFGGTDALEHLGSAVEIDERATLEILAEEVAFFVRSGQYGTYGISRALVLAMSRIPWSSLDEMLPFLGWDQAYAVIQSRLPRQGSDDDPVPAYRPDAIERRPALDGTAALSPRGRRRLGSCRLCIDNGRGGSPLESGTRGQTKDPSGDQAAAGRRAGPHQHGVAETVPQHFGSDDLDMVALRIA